MDRIPFGVLNKTITGLGATTLEITNQERDSIIVVPTNHWHMASTNQPTTILEMDMLSILEVR